MKKHVIIEYVICDGFLEKPGNISFSLSSIPRFPSCKTATGEKKYIKAEGFPRSFCRPDFFHQAWTFLQSCVLRTLGGKTGVG